MNIENAIASTPVNTDTIHAASKAVIKEAMQPSDTLHPIKHTNEYTGIKDKKRGKTIAVTNAVKKTEFVKRDTISNAALPTTYSTGAPVTEVLRIQGTPSTFMKYNNKTEVFYYGKSSVYLKNNKVTNYTNTDNNLRISK